MYANVSSMSFGADRVTTGVSYRLREPIFMSRKNCPTARRAFVSFVGIAKRSRARMQNAEEDRSSLWTLTHDTPRTDEWYRKQVDNSRSRGAKGTIDVSRHAAAPQRDRDSRSKWAMPRYGYGSIKRSDSTEGGGAAWRAGTGSRATQRDGSCVVR